MNVLIYGAGAVGLGLASFLLRSGARVQLIAREETVHALREDGLRRTGIFGEDQAQPGTFAAFSSLNGLVESAELDYVLVCVKSFDSENAARDIADHPGILGRKTKLVLFQNGWGNKEIFESVLSTRPIYTARVITGFRRPRKNHVDITVHADAVKIGSLDPVGRERLEAELGALSEAIARGGFPCEVTGDVSKDVWAKILYNCALNPLGAIFGVPYGVLAEWEPSRLIMNDIFAEIYLVMNAHGLATHWPTAEEYGKVFYGRLVPSTAAHISSTLQDARLQKRTEIDSLTGAVLKLGESASIAAPVNRTVYRIVKFLEARNLSQASVARGEPLPADKP